MRTGRSVVIMLTVGLLAGLVVGCGSSKKEPPLTLTQRLLRDGDMSGYDRVPAHGNTPSIGKATNWNQFLKGNPLVPDPKKARPRLASLKSGFVQAATVQLAPAASLPPKGLRPRRRPKSHPPVFLPRPTTGGVSGVAQFRSADDAKKALGLLDLEGYAPCPEKCDVRAHALTVPGVPGAKGVKRSGHAVDNGKPFVFYQVLFSDGPFVYGLGLGGQPPNQAHAQLLLTAAKKLYDETKGH